jgi:hypothetical protein
MNVILLGHYDIASLYALEHVMRLLPEHRYSVFLSGELMTQSAPNERLAELASVDKQLCERFLAGDLIGPVSRELLLLPELMLPNSKDGLRKVQSLRPELVISIRYRRILQPEFINASSTPGSTPGQSSRSLVVRRAQNPPTLPMCLACTLWVVTQLFAQVVPLRVTVRCLAPRR